MIAPGQVVTVLEILRAYAEAYAEGAYALALVSSAMVEEERHGNDVRQNRLLLQRLNGHLVKLLANCEHLPMTALSVKSLLEIINSPETMRAWDRAEMVLHTSLAEVQSRLRDELSLNLFFKLPAEKKRYFDTPQEGWEAVLSRFPDAIPDTEEMAKCFALSRYAASVFHAVAVIEIGLLRLGEFLKVNDPHSGWTAVTAKLDKIINAKYDTLTDAEKRYRPFLEQTHAVANALKSAWRNKISHAQGKLRVMTSEFSPDVAEEIIIASRSFMRRLATEMPEGSL